MERFAHHILVRPSIRFLDPPPLPINFVHDLVFNYFQQKNVHFVLFQSKVSLSQKSFSWTDPQLFPTMC